jgi:hypothetical protein
MPSPAGMVVAIAPPPLRVHPNLAAVSWPVRGRFAAAHTMPPLRPCAARRRRRPRSYYTHTTVGTEWILRSFHNVN